MPSGWTRSSCSPSSSPAGAAGRHLTTAGNCGGSSPAGQAGASLPSPFRPRRLSLSRSSAVQDPRKETLCLRVKAALPREPRGGDAEATLTERRWWPQVPWGFVPGVHKHRQACKIGLKTGSPHILSRPRCVCVPAMCAVSVFVFLSLVCTFVLVVTQVHNTHKAVCVQVQRGTCTSTQEAETQNSSLYTQNSSHNTHSNWLACGITHTFL